MYKFLKLYAKLLNKPQTSPKTYKFIGIYFKIRHYYAKFATQPTADVGVDRNLSCRNIYNSHKLIQYFIF